MLADVAIVASANPNNLKMLTNVARACMSRGLSVVFLEKGEQLRRFSEQRRGDGGLIRQNERARLHYRQIKQAKYEELPVTLASGLYRVGSPFWLFYAMRVYQNHLPEKPFRALIMATDFSSFPNSLVQYARLKAIPSVVIQEGASVSVLDEHLKSGSKSNRFYDAIYNALNRLVKYRLQDHTPDMLNMKARYACVYGAYMREQLIRLGRDPESIFVTGDPKLDDMPSIDPASDESRVVLFAHQHLYRFKREQAFYDQLAATCCDQLGYTLRIKLHPHSPKQYDDMVDRTRKTLTHPQRLEVTREGRMEDALKEARVLLTYYSTSAFDAVLREVPVILVNYMKTEIVLDLDRFGVAARVDEPEQLKPVLENVLASDSIRSDMRAARPRALEDYFHKLDGRSAQRVLDAVERVMIEK